MFLTKNVTGYFWNYAVQDKNKYNHGSSKKRYFFESMNAYFL